MCQPRGSGKRSGVLGCNCGCCGCGCGPFFRRFITEKEEEERLEEYKEQLKKELEGLEERIREFKRK
jgi:hypothetical protein